MATWQGSDLTLPPALVTAVLSHQYHTAAIGACPRAGSADPGFTGYKVTVLLQ
ncbi:MAG TPA: hypothetical protein VGD62_04515 [Acidobacteriaceae bacterium]